MHCFRPFADVEIEVGGKQVAKEPFEAMACEAVDVSAWREGVFDFDARNVEWAKEHPVDVRSVDVPKDCAARLRDGEGEPHMVTRAGDLSLGWSLEKSEFGAEGPVLLHLWADNPTSKAVGLSQCGLRGAMGGKRYRVYDAYGHLLKTRGGSADCIDTGSAAESVFVGCMPDATENSKLPAHTCVDALGTGVGINLAAEYDLPPGRYTVALDEDSRTQACQAVEVPLVRKPGMDLTFDVVAR